eukprot:scaffold206716_cov45-Prasinocladus_malaysianus.AAC.2
MDKVGCERVFDCVLLTLLANTFCQSLEWNFDRDIPVLPGPHCMLSFPYDAPDQKDWPPECLVACAAAPLCAAQNDNFSRC